MDIKDRYVMELPSIIILGRGVIKEVEGFVGERFESPVYVVGNYTKRFVKGEKIFVESPSKEILDALENEDYDVVVGVGGGKNLDAAKYLSKRWKVPYILVPTLPSSDGIASPAISLLTSSGRVSLLHHPPHAILLDHDILSSAPRKYILAGFGDVVAKYSSLYDWWLGHRRTGEYFGVLTYKLTKFAVSHVVSWRKRITTPPGVHVLLESLILCGGGIGIQGSSRPASGSEHLISHALDLLRLRNGERPGLHGLQVGISTIFTSYLQGRNWSWVKRVLSEAGHPTRLEDLDIDEDLYADAVLLAPRLRNRYTILNEVRLDRRRIREILEEVGMV